MPNAVKGMVEKPALKLPLKGEDMLPLKFGKAAVRGMPGNGCTAGRPRNCPCDGLGASNKATMAAKTSR